MQSNAALQRLYPTWCAFQVPVQNPDVSNALKRHDIGSLISWCLRRPNQGSNSDQDDQGNSRKGAKSARLRRIITGSEVILTPESVDALQNSRAAAAAGLNSDEILRPYFSNDHFGFPDSSILLRTSGSRPLLSGYIPPGIDPWFLGGLDPFSSLPHTDEEPLPKKSLIYHCECSTLPAKK